MRALGEQDLVWQYRRFLETKYGLGAFLKGKKSLKGSAMLLSWQHCASPFLQLWASPTENMRCVNRMLIKLVPLK